MQNPYIPYPVEVAKIITEVDTKDIKTFRFEFVHKEDEASSPISRDNSPSFPSMARASLPSGLPPRLHSRATSSLRCSGRAS